MTDGLARVLFDEAGNAIKVTQDGADFKYEFLGKLRNAAGTIVNPATQETLAAADTKLGTIDSALGSIKDTDGIKKITDQLPAGTNNIGDVDVASSALPAGAATEATLAALAAEDFATETTLASIKDTDGIKKITDGVQLQAGTNEIGKVAQGTKAAAVDGWPIVLYDEDGNPVTVTLDQGVYRLEISGKVTVVGALPPPDTDAVEIFADTPLTVGSDDTTYEIPDGETFYLQQIVVGNEDPTKGAVLEVLFDDGDEHLISRIYTSGQTLSIGYSDVQTARDGTPLVGAAGTSDIIVRRTKYSGTNIAIDAEVRGYRV